MPNRLATSRSPYLLQHRDNPIDWYPWGEEAFERARVEDKPVFLSIGYSSCHWCHVMAHESFEDEEVAEALNRYFVSVKVDREEHPDVDEAYMTAVQLANGHGGWPMTLFLLPDKRPFFAATYLPRDGRAGMPGFLNLVLSIASAWRRDREEIIRSANEFGQVLSQTLTQHIGPSRPELDRSLLDESLQSIRQTYDSRHGGFGTKPKFPPHSALLLLLETVENGWVDNHTSNELLAMAFFTLERMALGGIHDHVGGGFHRYSTDERWLLPHFEKMLYDNGLLLEAYSRAARASRDARERSLFFRTARGIVSWLQREMAGEDGLFASALDADSEGEEGAYYLWTQDEIEAALGDRARPFAEAFGVRSEGNFLDEATRRRTGKNVLHLSRDDGGEFREELDRLAEARARRPRPMRDWKAIAAWNGLAIAGLTASGETEMAARCLAAWSGAETSHGGLPHLVVDGEPVGSGYLDDYALLAWGASALADRTGEAEHRAFAEALTRAMVDRFYDASKGAFFATSADHERLFGKTKPALDQAIPAANAYAIRCLMKIGDWKRAEESLHALLGWMQRVPYATESLVATAALFLQSRPPSIVVPRPALVPKAEIEVRLEDPEVEVHPDGFAYGRLLLRVPEPFHVNTAYPSVRWLIPTRVEAEGAEAYASYPEGEADRYEGDVEIPLRIKPSEIPQVVHLKVTYQPCTETECLAPEEKRLTLKIR